MHIAHSLVHAEAKVKRVRPEKVRSSTWSQRWNNKEYERLCATKYAKSIKTIQEQVPGWMPDKVQY